MRSRPNNRRDLGAEVEGDDSDLDKASNKSRRNRNKKSVVTELPKED